MGLKLLAHYIINYLYIYCLELDLRILNQSRSELPEMKFFPHGTLALFFFFFKLCSHPVVSVRPKLIIHRIKGC